MRTSKPQQVLHSLASEFEAIVGLPPRYDSDFEKAALDLAEYLSQYELLPLDFRRTRFLAHVNWKFRVNTPGLTHFYALAAKHGYTFNYHQKVEVQFAFDSSSQNALEPVLNRVIPDERIASELIRAFSPASNETTINTLRSECANPTKLRRPAKGRDIELSILQAQFAAFLFCSLPEQDMHRYFDPLHSDTNYHTRFWDELHARSPHLFNRKRALYVARINKDSFGESTDCSDATDQLCTWVADSYEELNNYSYLAILFEPVHFSDGSNQWSLVETAQLYAEKHRAGPINKGHFRSQQIKEQTTAHIPELDPESCRFDLAHEGFSYKDCFVISPEETASQDHASLLVLFQKNERDDTLIPCPSCRSPVVQSNSYSSFGVKSWECRNLLCPDRSKYNRGKRYSFKGLLMQEAIDDEHNEIPSNSVRSWSRDVQISRTNSEILDMLLRHYSLYDDTVHLFNWPDSSEQTHGRHLIHHHSFPDADLRPSAFFHGPFFNRYIIDKEPAQEENADFLGDESIQVICGEAQRVLYDFDSEIFSGAVTSPPYYNARDYSQWDNIYCYLHDMYNIAREVYRCLQPGALYLYNIFDYFDNERIVAFSAMGQKRLTLSAYTVDMFKRIGFEFLGNTAWDKGEIEGKRAFNAGNFSPYYQAPFNCWEHILIFRKPSSFDAAVDDRLAFPSILRAKPVTKMVRGENRHGHTAPFPEQVPELLTRRLNPGSVVLDPFAGSLTTGRVAEQYGLRAVCIERHRDYCDLGLKMIEEDRIDRDVAGRQVELPI